MALHERQRQNYLEMMGITSYFPRFGLPGARVLEIAPPVEENTGSAINQFLETDFPPVTEKTSSATNAINHKQAPEAKIEPVEEIEADRGLELLTQSAIVNRGNENSDSPLIGKIDSQKEIANDDISNKNIAKTSQELEVVRFQLAFIRVNEDLCVLNQIPYVGSNQGLARSQQQLLSNILLACQVKFEELEYHSTMPFRWPFSEVGHLDNSEAAARAALSGYLQQQHVVKPFATLLVMGELASSFIKPESGDGHSLWQCIETRSLDEMLNHWPFKQEAWLQLQSHFR